MSHLPALYWAQFKIRLTVQFTYRVAVFAYMLGAIMQPTIYLVVWTTVAQAQGGTVGTFSVADFAAYYLTLMFVEHLTFTFTMWEYDYRIRMGRLSGQLLQPIHPIHGDLMDNLAYKALGLVMLIPGAMILGWTFRPNFNTEPETLLYFIPAFLLAFVLRFGLGYILALIAFWTNRNRAINSTYFVVFLFLSGRLTPIELLPEPLLTIANTLPFRWMVSFPVELFIGQLSRPEMIQGISIQAAWAVAIVLAIRVIWQRGVKRYTAYGG